MVPETTDFNVNIPDIANLLVISLKKGILPIQCSKMSKILNFFRKKDTLSTSDSIIFFNFVQFFTTFAVRKK